MNTQVSIMAVIDTADRSKSEEKECYEVEKGQVKAHHTELRSLEHVSPCDNLWS